MIQLQKAFDGMIFTNRRLKSNMKKVYVVDDEFEVLLSLSRWFMSKGCFVKTFSKSEPLFDALHEDLPDMIVMDMQLQNEDTTEVCRQIKLQFPAGMPLVLFCAASHRVKEVKDTYADYLIEPSSIREKAMQILLPSYTSAYSY